MGLNPSLYPMTDFDQQTKFLISITTAAGLLILPHFLSFLAPDWWSMLPARWKSIIDILPLLPLLLAAARFLYAKEEIALKSRPAQQEIQPSREEIQKRDERLQALFTLNQRSLQAQQEREVIDHALEAAVELSEAEGASYVPLDKHAYPLESCTYGTQPTTDIQAWVEYLASPAVHGRCKSCQKKEAVDNCPLLQDPFDQSLRLYCFPLRLGDRELGVINVYLKANEPLDDETQQFVQMIADHLSLSLENVHLKQRSHLDLQKSQIADGPGDLRQLLREELKHVQTLFDTDFASVTLQGPQEDAINSQMEMGALPDHSQQDVRSLVQRVFDSGESVLLANGDQGPGETLNAHHSFMAAPFTSQGQDISGVLLLGKRGRKSFHPQQLTVLESIVQQFSVVIHNMNLMNELKYQTMLQERTRLAREIHDGLAQTLGYLKLQIAQIRRAVENEETHKLKPIVDQSHHVVAEAYNDAREAIDGLQVDPTEKSFSTWLKQTISIFKENSGIESTNLVIDHTQDLPPEVQIQLIRIIQEGLSNIRKHARASQVDVLSRDEQEGVTFEIRDNGRGFSPQDTRDYLQHGLRGMRERARLIKADFQIISRPGQGTTLHIHWRPPGKETSHA